MKPAEFPRTPAQIEAEEENASPPDDSEILGVSPRQMREAIQAEEPEPPSALLDPEID